MDILLLVGILLGASGLLVGCALALLTHDEMRYLARHVELVRTFLFVFVTVAAAATIPHWSGAILAMATLGAFLFWHAHPASDMIALVVLAFALLFGMPDARAHLVSLVFLFGLPAGSLFVYREGIVSARLALLRIAAVHGKNLLGALFFALIISAL